MSIIIMVGLMAFFPHVGLFTLSMINQIKNWTKIVFYSIFSKATRGGIDYF